MKYVIVGGVTGGAGTAARLRRLDEKAEIIIFEKGPYVSYSNCSSPYRLSETVDQTEKLILNTPQSFLGIYNIEVRVSSQVISIDRETKRVHVKDLQNGREYDESYDKLLLSPGAEPVVPSINGIEEANLFTIRNVEDVSRFYSFIKEKNINNISVVGGGFIGVEVAVNLKEAGYQVTMVEAMPQILRTFDYDMVQILQKEMLDKRVDLIVDDAVMAFEKSDLILKSGRKIK